MKKWPENNGLAQFSDLVGPIKKAMLFAYNIERKNDGKSIPWNGYDIGEKDKTCCHSPNHALSAETLRYNKEDQDSDAFDSILTIAVQLGIEQGRRIQMQEIKKWKTALEIKLFNVVRKTVDDYFVECK